jgi:lipopolysaccharide/colanic/teichoic acid biosynthesis glycosyltransferase
LKAAAAASALTAVLMFSFNRLDGIPRSMPLLHFLVLGAMLAGGRLASAEYRRASHSSETPAGWTYENVILVGANDLASLYLRMLGTIKESPPRTRVLALLDDRERLHGRAIDGHIVLGGIGRARPLIEEYASHGVEVTKVLVALADTASRKAAAESLAASCGDLVRIELLAERLGLETPADGDANLVESSDGSASGPTTTYWKARRVCDVLLAAIAMVTLAPLFVLTAVLVWFDVGSPTLFWQERVGRGGRKILVHKFRTLKSLVDRSGRVLGEDERLSSIGRFLRNTRLDELPQLVDILRGDMSIVGPRPLLPVDLPKDASVRLSVRPGLTGWAQVHGGKRISAQEKNALDVWYIKHASFALDVRILFLTVMIMLGGDKRDDAVITQAMNNVTNNGSGGGRAPETAAT